MLCNACQQIFSGHQMLEEPTSFIYTHHHASLRLLSEASDSGCWICRRLLVAISKNISDERNSSKWRLTRRSWPKSSYLLWFYDGDEYLASLTLVPYNEYDGPTTNSAPAAGSSTMSDAALGQAKNWYHECLSKHSACNSALATRPQMPTRLLRIDEDQRYTRLVVTREEVNKDSDYLTLSHCWGDLHILKLTSQNLDRFRAGISLDQLPKTFAEAITVARKLSVPYIWIDSLCIIQDSIADWQIESALMEDIYSNSKLNIMATVSKNSHEGLSRARDPRNLELCSVIETKWKNAENDLFYLVNEVIWVRTMNSAPLIKRGWVLQERILSPRSLHFCDNELFWECREMIACETYPAGLPVICNNNPQSNIKIRELSVAEAYKKMYLVEGANKTKKGVAYDRWVTWISLYSQAYLTKDSDKLVAISALAKFTRTALSDIYVAGLWRSSFVDQLVWYNLHSSPPLSEYRAPSWSWASVNGLTFLAPIRPNTIYQIEVDEIQVTPVSKFDDTGSILDGFFRARGLLIPKTLVKDPKYDRLFYFAGDIHAPMHVHLDTLVGQYDTPVVVLPVLMYSLQPEDNPRKQRPSQFHALLLQRKAGSPNGFYIRIGHVESETSFIKNESYEKRSGFRKSLRKLLCRESGSSSKPPGLHIIGTRTDSGIDESLYLVDLPGSFVVY